MWLSRFRWTQCQIDSLKRCATAKDIRTTLHGLPSGLNETYERILGAIDLQSSDGKVARRALVWLVAALQPLKLAEILEGLSIDLRGRRLDREIAPVHGYALLDALGSLVVYNEESGVIILSHYSVKVGCKHLAYPCLGLTHHSGVPCWMVESHEPVHWRVSYRYAGSSCTGGTLLHVLYCCRDQILATF